VPDDGSTWVVPLTHRTAPGAMSHFGPQPDRLASTSATAAVDLRRWRRLRRLARGGADAGSHGFLRNAGQVLAATSALRCSDWLGNPLPMASVRLAAAVR
jgi:hypothetical protein